MLSLTLILGSWDQGRCHCAVVHTDCTAKRPRAPLLPSGFAQRQAVRCLNCSLHPEMCFPLLEATERMPGLRLHARHVPTHLGMEAAEELTVVRSAGSSRASQVL